jgi:hypothetical protein
MMRRIECAERMCLNGVANICKHDDDTDRECFRCTGCLLQEAIGDSALSSRSDAL